MVGVEVGSPGPAVRFRPDGFAGSALRLNARRCDKPALYSNDPAPGRLIIHYFLSEVRASPCADLLALVISCMVGVALIRHLFKFSTLLSAGGSIPSHEIAVYVYSQPCVPQPGGPCGRHNAWLWLGFFST